MADLLNNDLFDEQSFNEKNTMSFLEEKTTKGKDGLYRPVLKDGKSRTILRFLPNLTREGKIGLSGLEKISHFVKVQDDDLKGYYDSPRNFGEDCGLTKLYFTLKESKNAIIRSRMNQLDFSRKYYSYVLIVEDKNQPELEGKVMIFQYGKTILDMIKAEDNGDIDGEKCNVFSLTSGKDFILNVKEVEFYDEKSGKTRTFPNYDASQFRSERGALAIPYSNDGEIAWKKVPLKDGNIPTAAKEKIQELLLSREYELEDFGPQPLTDKQKENIQRITDLLLSKNTSSSTNTNTSTNEDFSEDFSFETETETATSESNSSDDDEFDFDF